ncbi:MAG: folylpolyglutamate synthase/dihydrofolate synthase family protein [Bacteroidales bacterium]|jgi:dihydrofolate synthase/folylpolyglutamate synthase|nr:bifunctional folylpolyglutamate synthase/dihydrofolate synthase [Bacteroidales bacterium]MDD3700816.1 bifunctional folylpolyglutamate synthase/dihydrofolate synthase [Bacteroidales bacterium]MDY0369401.1 folylpolyglutamate synthase/dihydrofolate synthase family protein [Bacteroidales bacterium]
MQYSEIIQWMFGKLPMYQRIGSAAYKADLKQTIELLDLLNNPQTQFRSIHIAGTNGKGSVSHMLASVLQESGYKTGLYTSPHLKDFRERIRINGQMIPENKVVQFITAHQPDFEAMQLSFFEMTVGLAFDYFAKEQVDVAVVETGMGGRLDSTNLLQPLLSIITNIGYDHMQFLGNTLAAIAVEKAGIIKKGVPVIIGQTHSETKDIFQEKAVAYQAPIVFADQYIEAKPVAKPDTYHQYFDIWKHNNIWIETVCLPLLGNYQKHNLITVMAALEQLRSDFIIQDEYIRLGLEKVSSNTGLLGRWQVLQQMPLAIADTGHNKDGLSAVVEQLRSLSYARLHFVLGIVNDKDISNILALLPRHAIYYFCKADIPRGMPADELAVKAFEFQLHGRVYDSVRAAWQSAKNAAHPNDLIFVGGSSFVVAEVV